MRTLILAGDTVWNPADVEVWVVTDEEFDYIMEQEKGYRDVTPQKKFSVEHLADDILID